MITLYIIYGKKNGNISGDLSLWYFYFVTLIISFNPLIIGIIRLIQTGSYKLITNKCKKKDLLRESLLINNENDNELNIGHFEIQPRQVAVEHNLLATNEKNLALNQIMNVILIKITVMKQKNI